SILGAKKPLLTPAEAEAVQADLGTYADLLPAAARATLAPWLGAPTTPDTLGAVERYAPITDFQPELTPATAIVP
nr:hypothetical protein [Tanacetum cinerariifolium]